MNRRSQARRPISLNALVHPRQGRSWMCEIRDFCAGGMLLTSDDGARSLTATGANPQRDDPVNIHFSVPLDGAVRHFRLQALIARVLESGSGMGVRFPQPLSGIALRALEQHASEMPDAAADSKEHEPEPGSLRDPRISAADADRITAQLREIVENALPKLSKAFFDKADQDLLIKARDAGSNQLQTLVFDAMNLLDKRRGQVDAMLVAEVVDQIDEVVDLETALERRRKSEPVGENPQTLSLVDTDEFEDWLAVAEIVSKAEGQFSQPLSELRQRLGLLNKPWSHKDVMPLGPGVITRALDSAAELGQLPREVKREVYRALQAAATPVLRNMYSAATEMLEKSGIFPPLDELAAPKPRPVNRPAPGASPPPPPPVEGDAAMADADAAVGSGPAASGDPFGPVPPPAGGPGVTPVRPAAGMDALGQEPYTGGAPLAGAAASVYDAARRLLDVSRRARAAIGQMSEAGVAAPGAAPHEIFEANEVRSALAELQARMTDAGGLSGRVKDSVLDVLRERDGGAARALSAAASDAMDVVENLVSSIRQDELLTDGVKDWVGKLEITLQKLALGNPEFLDPSAEHPHAAITVLNQLAKLGAASDEVDGIDRDIGEKVEELMESAVQGFDSDPAVFDRVAAELGPLVDRQTRAYRGNFERTVRASEGQQKLGRARRAVVRAMEDKLADRNVPQVLIDMLNPAWRNLMVHTHLRHGEDSEAWSERLDVLDRLLRALTRGVQDKADADALIGQVDAGLDNISFEPGQRVPLLNALRAALTEGQVGRRVRVRRDQTASVLGLEGVLPDTDPEPEIDDADQQQEWNNWLAKARRLRTGEWLAVADESGRPRITTLAFIGEEHASFVFVNRKGIKVKELTLKELTDGLFRGEISILDEADMPLMERASHRMLQNMHNQLAYQASHDELTGLINRKEFERRLEQAIASARTEDYEHVLLYIDLDQFKIINNTSGHDAGDALLKDLAGKLKHELRGVRSTLARLGGDEFGVLLERTGLEDGQTIAGKELEMIRGSRFDWEGRHFSVSASIGIVLLDAGISDVTTLMRNADAACYAAKDAGRNRVQVYEVDDSRLALRHGIMEWVAQIDRALDDNRLQLNCQRIAPIGHVENAEPHYEILLQMLDDGGRAMPPSDFIFAAETYNRMAAIDRWVIRHAFNWMSMHRREMESFGGFSINISGHSLNDDAFADFVLKQFSTTRVPTGKVIFEVTETAAIANIDHAIEFMNKMKIIGCQFSLDDFGTGLSSYSYLRNLPVDYVKIDGVFVKDLANNPGDYAVVKSINEIGHFMGKRTIAEFVEDNDILDNLREIGVDYAQGYGIEKPRRLEDFMKL